MGKQRKVALVGITENRITVRNTQKSEKASQASDRESKVVVYEKLEKSDIRTSSHGGKVGSSSEQWMGNSQGGMVKRRIAAHIRRNRQSPRAIASSSSTWNTQLAPFPPPNAVSRGVVNEKSDHIQ